ncbi:MAG: type II toxin-antitoxin system VapC family toxin [Candidatus Obscuribacterales bacterium]|nr:type II toxin-antitoxin system VapC family toxin [Candidatus Obscuribacterales bacterium]
MKFMLDTNICAALINGSSPQALVHISRCQIGEVGISSICLGELRHGVENSTHKTQNIAALERFLLDIEIVNFDESAAESYGRVRAFLKRKGTLIGPLDMLIGAHALALQSTLATNNVKEFRRIPKLSVVDWLR